MSQLTIPAAHAALLAVFPDTTDAVLEANREGDLHESQRRRRVFERRSIVGVLTGLGLADLGACAVAGGLAGPSALLAVTAAVVTVPIGAGVAVQRSYRRRLKHGVKLTRGRLTGRRIDSSTVHVRFEDDGRVLSSNPDLVGLPVEAMMWGRRVVALGLDMELARQELPLE